MQRQLRQAESLFKGCFWYKSGICLYLLLLLNGTATSREQASKRAVLTAASLFFIFAASPIKTTFTIGKGDIETRKGKTANGSFGVRRKRKSAAAATAPKPVAKVSKEPEMAKKVNA